MCCQGSEFSVKYYSFGFENHLIWHFSCNSISWSVSLYLYFLFLLLLQVRYLSHRVPVCSCLPCVFMACLVSVLFPFLFFLFLLSHYVKLSSAVFSPVTSPPCYHVSICRLSRLVVSRRPSLLCVPLFLVVFYLYFMALFLGIAYILQDRIKVILLFLLQSTFDSHTADLWHTVHDIFITSL